MMINAGCPSFFGFGLEDGRVPTFWLLRPMTMELRLIEAPPVPSNFLLCFLLAVPLHLLDTYPFLCCPGFMPRAGNHVSKLLEGTSGRDC